MLFCGRLLMVLVMTLFLAGCATLGDAMDELARPTIGPVQNSEYQPGRIYVELRANTNCAELQEIVMFTMIIENRETYPLILSGTPPIEIMIGPLDTGDPLHPKTIWWSRTPAYPSTIERVLQAGERRTYMWPWTAEKSSLPGVHPDLMIKTSFLTQAPQGVPQGNGTSIAIGVEAIGFGQGVVPCSQMRR